MRPGPLSAEQQLALLTKIWGRSSSGYVFLPYIDGHSKTVEERRRNYHEGRAFAWPKERDAILSHLTAHTGDDLYFTPAVFNGKRRIEQYLAPEHALWADLDEADPRQGDMVDRYKPTIAWESSPGRFQGVWLVDRPKMGASWGGKENHRLTMHLGADKSGWDSTQLLRVPGRRNHKPSHGDNGAPGKLLWDNGPRYQWHQFDELPEVASADNLELFDEDLLNTIDRHEVWAKYKLKVSKHVREYMAMRTTEGHDRSAVAWQIARELADAGCSMAEVVAVIRPSLWNKYAGRSDELKRLKIEAAKAVDERAEVLEEEDEVERPESPDWGSAWFRTPTPRPRWLVNNIWSEGSCGFISGAPKSYKSWTALDLALSVATGLPFLGEFRVKSPGPVLYLQEEDSVQLVKDRYRIILEGKDVQMHPQGYVTLAPTQTPTSTLPASQKRLSGRPAVYFMPPVADVRIDMQVQSGFIASDPGWQSWLEERVAKYKFKLVVIDTLTTTAGEIDTDRAQDLMGKMLKPLKQIAQKHNTAICIVHHNRKGDGTQRAGQDMLGSVALHAWVDCALYARSKEGREILIDRESKQTTDLRFTMSVPHMEEKPWLPDAERQLWEPIITEKGDDVGIPQETKKDRSHTPDGAPRSGAGKALAAKMKVFGNRWITLDEFEVVFGSGMGGQLSAAIANGFVEFDDTTNKYRRLE